MKTEHKLLEGPKLKDFSQNNALHLAVMNFRVEIVNHLLNASYRVSSLNKEGLTVLHHLIRNKQ